MRKNIIRNHVEKIVSSKLILERKTISKNIFPNNLQIISRKKKFKNQYEKIAEKLFVLVAL